MSRRKPPAAGPLAFIETGDIIAYSVKNRTLDVVGIAGRNARPKRSPACWPNAPKKGVVPRPPRKGLYKRYTSHALSAMQGAGYED